MKNLWFRAGVTLQLNDDEVDTILKTGADDNGDMDIVENVVKTALQEGRFAFDGNSYFPEPVVESLIQAEGLPYAPSEPEFDMSRLGGFTLAKPAVNGDMLSRASALIDRVVNEKDYHWSGVVREVTVNSDGISLFINKQRRIQFLCNPGPDKGTPGFRSGYAGREGGGAPAWSQDAPGFFGCPRSA